MNTFMLVIALIGQGNSGWASQPEREPTVVASAVSPSTVRVLEFARQPLPSKFRWVADPEPSVEAQTEPPASVPNATAAQDAHGFTFYSLIDARGMTHWGYDWARLWNEVQAVNADRAAQPPNTRPVYGQPTYGQPATYGYGYGTGGSGGRPQPWVVRAGVYGRPVAVVPLPGLGGAGTVCST